MPNRQLPFWKKHFKKLILVSIVVVLVMAGNLLLCAVGEMIVVDDTPVKSDAIVVLNTGLEYYPRLIEAADLYNKGYAKKIVLNGNRKDDVLRRLEEKGFTPCCDWCEDRLRVLTLFDVPRKDVVCISAEDAYDSISEAQIVAKSLSDKNLHDLIITTSKYHTRRARYIWRNGIPGKKFNIRMVSAKSDLYSPHGWWKEGRQIRWVMAEYGAWVYYFWKKLNGDDIH